MSLVVKSARVASQGAGRVMPGVGDPGLFGFLGNVAKRAVGGAAGFATGGIGGAIRGAGFGPKPAVPQRFFQQPAPPQIPPFVAGRGTGSFGRGVQALIPGGKTGFEGLQIACPKGHHPNKSDYFLKDGTFVPKGSRCVKNRSRNPLNPRALRRAVSRIDAGKVWQEKMRDIETSKFTKAGKRKAC